MRPIESLKISIRTIGSHKLRSTLTSLGVIIGIAAVITFMVLGGGFSQSVTGEFDELYSDAPTLLVQTEIPIPGGFGIMYGTSPIYTEHDINQIKEIPGVDFAAPWGIIPTHQTTHGDKKMTGTIQVQATTPEMFTYEKFIDGQPFEQKTNQAVINNQLFNYFGEIKVGDTISYTTEKGTTTLNITGIIEEDFMGVPPAIYVPIDPHYTITVDTPRGTNDLAYPFIWIGATSLEELPTVKDTVTQYLTTQSDANQLKGQDEKIVVQTLDDLITQIVEIIDQITIFVVGIAAIALVVGAIGIANIMIVSVVERTREIGIMKAVGAKNRDIIQLFLIESTILGIIGATVGVILGLAVGWLGTNLMNWPMVYPLDWITIAVVTGIAVGIASGLYPAWRAAKVDPIIALRTE
ncbi:ABC-type antimicrobial peptide transport system permease component [Methanonatronarchaeum thermophilum]|uniref:ABC-type antimicrobial peptide transport system permease component n=1 Tax=Methanonatronarchaeum thermophilum TaxID=1927129 RepID=A0A1Y3GC10_9EURY|nr:ABC transporter permease [Methanonatronarchaeum thermophilum]OUJ18787.1 ABC-type antimicrobial peptide transport system permease component [Methanonatronarchaeum thermophilum]